MSLKQLQLREIIVLVLICILFVSHSYYITNKDKIVEYAQDDAFISYRYVENFIEGHGLVFNYGERVEGYTNFLWIMILSLTTLIGLPIMMTSKILGLIFSLGTIILSFLMARDMVDYKRWYLALIPPLFLSLNGAFAMWTVTGMETAMFIFLALLVIAVEMKNPKLTPYFLVVATLTRPEGGLLFGIILLYRLFIQKQKFKEVGKYFITYVGILIPYAVFKLLYFGDILPNPFYAKTGLSEEYLKAGLEYLWRFAKFYGIFGVIFILPVVFIKKLTNTIKFIWLVVIIYTIYIVLVGGDVLKENRFFLPLLAPLYIVITFTAVNFYSKFKAQKWTNPILIILICGYAAWGLYGPWKDIAYTIKQEKALLFKMETMANDVRRIDKSNFSMSVSTIGRISYVLKGHRIIDMLGLTDPYIARNPERIEGMETTWKERNFNTTYLLEEIRPDYILFSTSYKPSAPAERALILNSHFRKNYITLVFPRGAMFDPIWKKIGDFSEPNRKMESPEYAMLIYDSYNFYLRQEYQSAIESLLKAVEIGENDFALPEHFLGTLYMKQGDYQKMATHFANALRIEPNCLESRLILYFYYKEAKDYNTMNIVYDEIKQVAPYFQAPWLVRAGLPPSQTNTPNSN